MGTGAWSRIAVGVNGNHADDNASTSGAGYVFVRSSGLWSQQAYLKGAESSASDADTGPGYRMTAGISGDSIVIGLPGEDSNGVGFGDDPTNELAGGAGAVLVYGRSGVTWTVRAYVKASNTGAGDRFGYGLAIHGDVFVVGASGEASDADGVGGNQADDSKSEVGAVYVFR